jgi:hypothetical protein
MVVEMLSVVSVIVAVPADAVVMTTVSDVEELFVFDTNVAPLTVKAVDPVQVVPTPVQASVMLPVWVAGTVAGVQLKLALGVPP